LAKDGFEKQVVQHTSRVGFIEIIQ